MVVCRSSRTKKSRRGPVARYSPDKGVQGRRSQLTTAYSDGHAKLQQEEGTDPG